MSKPGMGSLIVFEGVDSVGKTTLSRLLAQSLNELGRTTEWMAFPGRIPHTLGALVYEIHHDPKRELERLSPLALQLLHLAAHVDAIESSILPALQSGVNVVLDRFWWSMLAYGPQDSGGAAVLSKAVEIEKAGWRGVSPRVLFLLSRDKPFELEFYSEAWVSVRDKYLALAREEASHQNVVVVDAEADPATLVARMKNHLNLNEGRPL